MHLSSVEYNHKKMNILIVATDPDKSGGVANYYKTLLGNFSHQINYFIIGSRTDKDGFFSDIKRMAKDYKAFKKKICQTNYDIILINPTLDLKSVLRDGRFVQLAKKYCSAKLIVFWHGFYLNFFDKYIKKRGTAIFKNVFFKVDAHIVLGNIFKQKLQSIGCASPIYCETTIVGENFVRKEPKLFSQTDFNILFLARVEKDKGIYEAIDTYTIVNKQYPAATLIVAGNGFELANAKKYVLNNNIGGVSFLGDVRGQDKFSVLQNADVYLFPSYYEGMPTSVLEAMAMGLPVVTTNVGGLPDFFQNEKMGYITNSFKPEVLAEYVVKLFSNKILCKEISTTNILFAQQNFLLKVAVKRLETIFKEVKNATEGQ